jgi:hypothetical protein
VLPLASCQSSSESARKNVVSDEKNIALGIFRILKNNAQAGSVSLNTTLFAEHSLRDATCFCSFCISSSVVYAHELQIHLF